MKRSEMLISLEEMLLKSDNFEKGGCVELAEEFLLFIQKAGMLPPSQKIFNEYEEESSLYTYGYCYGDSYDQIEVGDFCKWEAEDGE